MTPAAAVMDLSVWQVGLAAVLVLVVVAISFRQALGLERDLLIASVRTVVQLYLVGLVLAAVFAADRWYWVALVLTGMTLVAAQTAVGRLKKPMPGAHAIAATAIVASTVLTLGWVTAVVVRVHPWYEPQYVVPIAGMILGNAMTSTALAGDRLQSELRMRTDEIEAMLALGFSGPEAVQPMVRSALRAAMLPTVTGMMTVGLVQLPGMMTGQILAGSSPLVAIEYQIVVMFMLAVASSTAALLFVRLAARRYLTPAHQLRRELL